MVKLELVKLGQRKNPLRRQYTERQVKPLSQTGILKTRYANWSITAR
jgi:hypothetical protein